MHIAVIAPTPYFSDRGCHIRIANEIQTVTEAGHTVTLFTYHNGKTPTQDSNNPRLTIKRISNVRWYTKTSAGAAWGKLWLDWKLYRLASKTLRDSPRHTFDIIHAHLHEGGLIASLLKRKYGLPVLLDLQDNLVETLQSQRFATIWPLPTFVAKFERWLLAQADAIVGSSVALTSHIKTLLPSTTLASIEALPDLPHAVIEHSNFTITRQQLQIEVDDPVIIYTGGISRAKGVHTLVQAFAQILLSYPDAKLVIAGSGKSDSIKKLIVAKGIGDSVRLILPLPFEDLFTYLRLADIAVEPKPAHSSEGSGKLVYYQMAGLPTVAFTRGDVDAYADSGVVWVEQDTTGDLTQALLVLLEDPLKRTQLADKAKLWSTSQPSWRDQRSIIEHLYERISN